MKILFLDIDGVLNSTRSVLTRTGKQLCEPGAYNALRMLCDGELLYGIRQSLETVDPVAVDLVNRLLLKDEALRIVLSSTHRSYFAAAYQVEYGSDEHLAALHTYLKALGLKAERFIDITPQLYLHRGAEIRRWLEQHSDVTHSCAVDDDADFAATDCNLVAVNSAIGFSADDYFKACRMLDIAESTLII